MFVTVAELNTYNDIVEADTTLTQTYIDSAEDIVQTYLGYTLAGQAYTQYLDGNNSRALALAAKPVILSEIAINGIIQTLSDFIITGEIISVIPDTLFFTRGYRNIKISFSAGYITPGGIQPPGITLPELPGLIKLTIMRIASLLSSEAKGKISVTSMSDNNTGNRTFYKTTNYSPYLAQISQYSIVREM